MEQEPLLKVRDLHTSFFTPAGEVKAVNGVSFNLDRGKVLGIVGESGSGKSVTAYSIMQILATTGKIVSGSIKLDGQELVGADESVMKTVRGNKVSIIFQDPMTSLNPTYTIGHQLMEHTTNFSLLRFLFQLLRNHKFQLVEKCLHKFL